MAYIKTDRNEISFFPPCVDDYVGPQEPVRAYDAFVEALDFAELGIHEIPGGNADEYDPRVLVKILIFGPSYGIRSSRYLERACRHNMSFIWLTGGVKPDFRTIGRFRRKHAEALKKILKQCVRMCLRLDLIEGNVLFVDGTGIRANAGVKNSWSVEQVEKRIHKIETEINLAVNIAVAQDIDEEKLSSLDELREDLRDKERLKAAVAEFAVMSGRSKLNTTDKDSVIMQTRQGTHSSYNAQVSADGKHGLVVSAEALSEAADRNQLSKDVDTATATLGKAPSTVCADAGFYSLKDMAKVDEKTTLVVPSGKLAHEERKGAIPAFDKSNFIYDEDRDTYTCPMGQVLAYHRDSSKGQRSYEGSGDVCRACKHFGICTKSKTGRSISREANEKLAEKLSSLYKSPAGHAIYRLRKQIIEPVFGHWKHNLGARQFLLRGTAGVNAELSILSTGFNLVRMITILGGVQAAIQAIKKA
jgi:transposase